MHAVAITAATRLHQLQVVDDNKPKWRFVGLAAGFQLVALASGLAIARMLTDPAWISANPAWTHMPETRAQQVLRAKAAARQRTRRPNLR